MREQAAAISGYNAQGDVGQAAGRVERRLRRFTMPLTALQVVAMRPQPGLLSPTVFMLVLVAWPAAALLAASVVITSRWRLR